MIVSTWVYIMDAQVICARIRYPSLVYLALSRYLEGRFIFVISMGPWKIHA